MKEVFIIVNQRRENKVKYRVKKKKKKKKKIKKEAAKQSVAGKFLNFA